MERQLRPLQINVRVTEAEKAVLERVSLRSGLTMSDYVRAGAMITAMIDGDTGAAKIAVGAIGAYVREKLAQVRATKAA